VKSVSLSSGWTVGPKRGPFDDVNGASAQRESVTLPHDAMLGLTRRADGESGASSGYFPGGAVEYTRELVLGPAAADQVHLLVFDGVYRDAAVFINDHFAGQSPFGYTRFAVPIDAFLKRDAANVIRVEARAHRDSRWYSGLGIHRNVALVTGPAVHLALDGVVVTTPEVSADEAMVVIASTIVNETRATRTVRVSTSIQGPDDRELAIANRPVTVLPGESATIHERLWIGEPARWSIDDAQLNRARVTVTDGAIVDDLDVTFGIRRLQLDARHGLRINGQTVKLRGACLHHDNGIIGSRSIARAEERRIELLKAAGFNAIRSAHNPISPELLDACDRLGMVVMDELADMWLEPKNPFDSSLAFAERWEREVESLVIKGRNHASLVFYSIGNEILEAGRPHGARLGRLLAEKVRELDPTRFTTNGTNGLIAAMNEIPSPGGEGQNANAAMADMGEMMTTLVASDTVTRLVEESFLATDAIGLNYGEGRYLTDAARFPQRVTIGTETFPTRIDLTWPLVMENDHIIGDFTWTGFDYLGEAGIGRVDYNEQGTYNGTSGAYPWLLAWCGDLDITGRRRPASYYREIVFGLRDAPALAVRRPRTDGLLPGAGPWSWSDSIASWSWSVPSGTPTTVEVYSSADEVELLLNGSRVGAAPVGRAHRYRAEFTVPFEPGELVAIARTAGVESGRDVLRSATGEVALRVVADRAEIAAADDDLAFVSIELADADGIVPPDNDRPVRVVVTGSGVLLGLGSGRPDSEETYSGSEHLTFDGRALAIVRPTGEGPITVTVTSDGVDPCSVTLMATKR
jgi:beta-galactosidase